jgi:hypothetical protein
MANDYGNLPTGIKVLKLVAGLCPPIATWKITGSVWYAAAAFLIGFIAGNAFSNWHTKFVFRHVRRDAEGQISGDDLERGLRRSLPVFMWAAPICGVLAAAFFIWL